MLNNKNYCLENNFLDTKYMSNVIDLPIRETYLPSDLWGIILTYTSDIITCKNLYHSLPNDIQNNIYTIYYNHIHSLSITILYSNIHTVSIYKNNKLYKDVIYLEKAIRFVRFRPHSNEFCTAGINGEVIFWDRYTFERVRSIQMPQYFIDQLEFHPDGTKMVTISGNQIKLWDIHTSSVSIVNSNGFIFPVYSIYVHNKKPIVYLARIFNNKLSVENR